MKADQLDETQLISFWRQFKLMARKSVLELQEAFEGLKFSVLSTNRALSRNKT